MVCSACDQHGDTKKCAQCGASRYCSKDCQQRDWKAHKPVCAILSAVDIDVHAQYGRVLRSRKAFSPGEVIFADPAFMTINSAEAATEMRLLERIVEELELEGLELLDPATFLPGVQFVKEPAAVQERLLDMFCPLDDLPDKVGRTIARAIAKMRAAKLLPATAATRSIHCAIATAMANSFGVTTKVRALHYYGSLLNHACLPNCDWSHQWSAAGTPIIVARALVDISPGDEIVWPYFAEERWAPRENRRLYLQASKFFTCQCVQCTAPDRTRAFRCPACGTGEMFLPRGCQQCGSEVPGGVQRLWEKLEDSAGKGALPEYSPSDPREAAQQHMAILLQCACHMTQHWVLIDLLVALHDWFKLDFQFGYAACVMADALAIMERLYPRHSKRAALLLERAADCIACQAGVNPARVIDPEFVSYYQGQEGEARRLRTARQPLLRPAHCRKLAALRGYDGGALGQARSRVDAANAYAAALACATTVYGHKDKKVEALKAKIEVVGVV